MTLKSKVGIRVKHADEYQTQSCTGGIPRNLDARKASNRKKLSSNQALELRAAVEWQIYSSLSVQNSSSGPYLCDNVGLQKVGT